MSCPVHTLLHTARVASADCHMLPLVAQIKNKLFLVMEYCAGGDLAGYIRQHRRISEDAARPLLQQLAAGLKELWSHNLVHVRSVPC